MVLKKHAFRYVCFVLWYCNNKAVVAKQLVLRVLYYLDVLYHVI